MVARLGDVSSFKGDLRRWAEQVDDLTKRKKATATRAIVTELVHSTPVLSGLTRSNWRASVGAVTSAVVPIRSTSETIQEAVAKVRDAKRDATIFIANNVPWIGKLNTGYSTQQAPGWINRAVARAAAVTRATRG